MTLSFLLSHMWVLCPFFISPTEWAAPMLWQEKIPAYDVFILSCVWCLNDAVLMSAGSCGYFTGLLPVSQLSTGLPNPHCCTELCAIPQYPFESHGYFYPMNENPYWVLVLGALLFLTSNLRDLELIFVHACTYSLCCFQCNQSTLPKCGANHRLNPKIWDWLAWHSVCMLNHWQG